MRGRKRKPTALRLLQGNPGKRPLNQHEPTYDALDPACPVELTDAAAQAEWARAIVPAIATRQITIADRPLAIAHCELWATWRSQVVDAARHAHVIASKAGNPMPNPARRMANQSLLLLVKVDSELGLTPSSRSRVSVRPQKPAVSKWAGAFK